MKKVFLILLCLFFMGGEVVWAQSGPVFSSSLAGGAAGYTRRGVRGIMYRPNLGYGVGNTTIITGAPNPISRTRKKYVFKYKTKQVDLTESQMEKLMPFIKRLREDRVKSLEMFCIAKDETVAEKRCNNLIGILNTYKPDFNPRHRIISGQAVVKSNDNTVEFIEYW